MTNPQAPVNGIHAKLQKIQCELKAPKNKRNNFGGYNYRDVSGICEGLKPLLDKYKCALHMSDDVLTTEDRTYIKATVIVTDCEDGSQVVATGLAREADEKKGMDPAQLTGSCSSYARKYALNGLFAIDDSRDMDSINNEEQPSRVSRRSRVKKDGECPF